MQLIMKTLRSKFREESVVTLLFLSFFLVPAFAQKNEIDSGAREKEMKLTAVIRAKLQEGTVMLQSSLYRNCTPCTPSIPQSLNPARTDALIRTPGKSEFQSVQ